MDKMIITLDKNNKTDLAIYKLSEALKSSLYDSKVYVSGEYVVDKITNGSSYTSLIELVTTSYFGCQEVANWICRKFDCIEYGENPIYVEEMSEAYFSLNGDEFSDMCFVIRAPKYDFKLDVPYRTLKKDIENKSFTIDSLYMNISTFIVEDPTNLGFEDITSKLIRAVDENVFKNNPLNILKAINLNIKLGGGWGIEKNTWLSMIENADGILKYDQGSITSEFNNMLISSNPSLGIRQMEWCGILKYVIPDVRMIIGFNERNNNGIDLFEHTMMVLSKVQPNIKNRMAALLHDIGKTKSYVKFSNGSIITSKHEYFSVSNAISIMKKMKYSDKTIASVINAIKYHDKFKELKDKCPSYRALKKMIERVGKEDMPLALDLIAANNVSHGSRQYYANQANLMRDRINSIMHQMEDSEKKFLIPINGNDIIKRFNLKTSPKIGKLLNMVKEKFSSNPTMTKEECFAVVEKSL